MMITDASDRWPRIAAQLEERGITTVLLQFTDIGGRCKGVSVPAERLHSILEHGQWIDGSSIDSSVRLRESDMLLRPDPATFALVQVEQGAEPLARMICTVCAMDGKPFAGDPRYVLQRAVQVAALRGYRYQVSPEVEFFVCHRDDTGHIQPLRDDRDSYFDLSPDPAASLRDALVRVLRDFGIAVESSHHEIASGQHEIDLSGMDALAAADALVTLKYVARRLARGTGLNITFMPKPFTGLSGSGLHIHQCLLATSSSDAQPAASADAANVFAERSRRGISEQGMQFIAGQLEHAGSLVALTNPLVNSYKRLASGHEAPATVSWAHESRSAFIRVPLASSKRGDTGRIEVRASDPSCNPYLALAALLRAGLAGIEGQLIAPDPVEEPVYPFELHERIPLGARPLPLTLGEAVQALSGSALLREVLGEHVFGRFVEMKRREWRAYLTTVTDWEQDTYWETA